MSIKFGIYLQRKYNKELNIITDAFKNITDVPESQQLIVKLLKTTSIIYLKNDYLSDALKILLKYQKTDQVLDALVVLMGHGVLNNKKVITLI